MFSSPLIRATVQIVSGLGVQRVVGDIIKNNTTVLTRMDKIFVTTGSLVLGSMLGDQAYKHVDKTMDSIRDGVSIQFKVEKEASDTPEE